MSTSEAPPAAKPAKRAIAKVWYSSGEYREVKLTPVVFLEAEEMNGEGASPMRTALTSVWIAEGRDGEFMAWARSVEHMVTEEADLPPTNGSTQSG